MITFRPLYRRCREGDCHDAIVAFMSRRWLGEWRKVPIRAEVTVASRDQQVTPDQPTSTYFEELWYREQRLLRIDLWLLALQFTWLGPWKREESPDNRRARSKI